MSDNIECHVCGALTTIERLSTHGQCIECGSHVVRQPHDQRPLSLAEILSIFAMGITFATCLYATIHYFLS